MTDRLLGTTEQITESEKARRLEEIYKRQHEACGDMEDLSEEEKNERMEIFYACAKEERELEEKYPDLPPESGPVVVYNVRKTCGACPSAWEGETEDGEEVYARYRWGYLSVSVGDKTIFGKQIDDGSDYQPEDAAEQELLKKFNGGVMSYAGTMDETELRIVTKGWFIWDF